MEISAEKFLETLEKNLEIPPVIIIWGEEDYYKEKIVKAVLQTTFAAVAERDREINVFDKELPLKELETNINSYPFFSGKNMVLIKDPKILKQDKQQDSEARKEQQAQLSELLTNVPDFCQIVCTVKKLDKRSKFYKALLPIAAIVEHGKVTNIILLETIEDAALFNAIPCDEGISIGWGYSDGVFTLPTLPPVDLDALKVALKAAVDAAAEDERHRYITSGSGQAMTYQAKAAEALRYADTDGAGEYPFLSMEVGITGATLADDAAVVLNMHNQWQAIGGQIEQARLSAKAQIDAAPDETTARAVVPIWPA